MIMQKKKAAKVHAEKMHAFLDAADDSGDGVISQTEWREILQDPQVCAWLAAQDLDTSDPDNMFILMDESRDKLAPPDPDAEESTLTADELVKGVGKLKGAAKALDIQILIHQLELRNLSAIAIAEERSRDAQAKHA